MPGILALGAAFAWGVGDFLGGRAARALPVLTVVAISQLAGLAAVLAWALASGDDVPSAARLAPALAAGAGGAVGLAALYRGMAVGAMGVVAPISALAPVVPLVAGIARGERPSPLQLAGIVLALGGVLVLSREPGTRRTAVGTGLALVAASGFGAYFVFLDAAAAASVPWAVTVARAAAAALTLAAALRLSVSLRPARPLVPALVAIGLADVGANVLFALASTRGLLSVVSVLASLYPVVTVALARLVLGERLAALQWVGGAAAIGGAVLVASG